MSRLPLRVRVTLVFALAMAIVLGLTGAFLYVRVGDSLTERVDDSLRSRANLLAAAARAGTFGQLQGGEEEFAQVVGRDGRIRVATRGFEEPLLPGANGVAGDVLTEARIFFPAENETEAARLLARPVGDELVVVGSSLEDRDEALGGLLAQLLIGGPLALLLASAAGYLLAGAALRPVEAMRRRAAEITAETPGERLPLPAAHDELHRLAATLNAMIDRLDAGLRRERRFVADASHELRTPLALLQAELELALRRPRTQAELEDALRSVAEEVDRLVRLAEDLLVLASTDSGRLPLQPVRVPVRELIDGVAARFSVCAAAAGTHIELGDVVAGEVTADRLRLEQALGNLVDNALRHGAGPVTLGAHRNGAAIIFGVRDRGRGFPPEFRARAFERFTRADESRASRGAGLGLAIVDAIARAHGGSADACSTPSGGAVVSITVPNGSAEPGDAGLIGPDRLRRTQDADQRTP